MSASDPAEPRRVALVTGAGSPLGRRLALALAAQGVAIAANDLSPQHLDETLEAIAALGGRARGYLEDTVRGMPVALLAEQVLGDWGRLDLLVHVAPVNPPAPLLGLDEWDWHRALDANLTAAALLIQRFAPALSQGAVLLAGAPPRPGVGTSAVYAAALAGLAGLVRSASAELAEAGIRINGMLPASLAGVLGLREPPGALLPVDALALSFCTPDGPTGRVGFYEMAETAR